MTVSIIIFAIVAFVILGIIGLYNGLIVLKNQVQNAYAQIEVQLKRRHDLIPNLVETVKGYMSHEAKTLEAVINARNAAARLSSDANLQSQNENMLSGALKSLFALSESYPDLKANQNFLNLQEELTSSENKIGFARQLYNDTVMQYNIKKEAFPNNLIVALFNLPNFTMFEIVNPDERNVVKVDFN